MRGASSEGREEKKGKPGEIGSQRERTLALLRERKSKRRMAANGKRSINREERWTRGEREHIVLGGENIQSMMRPSHRFTTGSLRARALLRFILFTLFSCCLFLYASLHLFSALPIPPRRSRLVSGRLRCLLPFSTQRLLPNLRLLCFFTHSLNTQHSTGGWAVYVKNCHATDTSRETMTCILITRPTAIYPISCWRERLAF